MKRLIQSFIFLAAATPIISQQVTLTYPIPELDNCRDAKECYLYCEIPRHASVCQQFSLTHHLPQVLGVSTKPSLAVLHSYAQTLGITYPIPKLNNCSDHYACKSYCNQSQNYSACTSFARQYNLLPL